MKSVEWQKNNECVKYDVCLVNVRDVKRMTCGEFADKIFWIGNEE